MSDWHWRARATTSVRNLAVAGGGTDRSLTLQVQVLRACGLHAAVEQAIAWLEKGGFLLYCRDTLCYLHNIKWSCKSWV